MDHFTNRLTATESAYLWANYMADSMALAMFSHFQKMAEDQELKEVLAYAMELSVSHVKSVASFLEQAGHAVPQGFGEQDVNPDAPRLFPDAFVILYLFEMANVGMTYYGKALAMVTRQDIHDYYMECLASSAELNSRIKKVKLEKGIYVRPPYVPVPHFNEMVHKQSFLKGIFGKGRPITVFEIGNAFYNLQTVNVVRVLSTAFMQVAQSEEARSYFKRGKQLSTETSEIFTDILIREDLPAPIPWDSYVTDSTEFTFSDKIMMFHGALLNGAGLEQYGFSLATSMRTDLALRYNQLAAEMQKYAEDGANLMIEKHWLEQIPLAPDREALAQV